MPNGTQEDLDTDLRLPPTELGSIRIGTMRTTKAHEAPPMNMLYLPRFQGPGLNRSPTKNTRIDIGIVKATNAAIAPIENKAPTARGPPKISKVIRIPTHVLNQTAFTGVSVVLLTRLIQEEPGRQPSRA